MDDRSSDEQRGFFGCESDGLAGYSDLDAEALRKAALETDIPEGGTLLGFGLKFPAKDSGSDMMGQNMRASPVVMQYVDRKVYVAWPKALQTIDPVLPLPKSSPFAI